MGKGAKGGVGFHTHPHHHFGGRRYRHWGGGGAARTEYHSIQNRSNYFYAHYEKRQKRAKQSEVKARRRSLNLGGKEAQAPAKKSAQARAQKASVNEL